MIDNLLGGRGKCEFCNEYHNNVSYHEAHECNKINKVKVKKMKIKIVKYKLNNNSSLK